MIDSQIWDWYLTPKYGIDIWLPNMGLIMGTKCTGNIFGGNGCIQSLLQLLGQSWLNDWFYIIFKRFVQRLGEQSFVFNRFLSTIFCQSLCQSLCQFFEKIVKNQRFKQKICFQKNVFKNFWQCLLRFSICHILYNPLFLQHFLQSIVNSNTYCNALKQ